MGDDGCVSDGAEFRNKSILLQILKFTCLGNMMTEVPELLDIASNLETLNMAHNKISRITGL